MSASELLQRLRSLPVGVELDWVGVRHEVVAEYDHATPAERATLLQIYTAVMEAAERGLPVAELITFRTARRQDYNRMLVSESRNERSQPAAWDLTTNSAVSRSVVPKRSSHCQNRPGRACVGCSVEGAEADSRLYSSR